MLLYIIIYFIFCLFCLINFTICAKIIDGKVILGHFIEMTIVSLIPIINLAFLVAAWHDLYISKDVYNKRIF